MIFRKAVVADIAQIQAVRHSVKENALSDPALVTDADCKEYITKRGSGWVCEIDHSIVGFAIADLDDDNIWALFVHPDYEQRGIGYQLHGMMMSWYFAQGKESVWLSTSPDTRAEIFYTKAGWKKTGIYGNGEIKFELNYLDWIQDLMIR